MSNDILTNMIVTKINTSVTVYNTENNKKHQKERSCWAIVVKYEGETIYTSNGKKYISNKNNIVLLPKGSCYKWVCTKRGHCAILEFECANTCEDLFGFKVKDGEEIYRILKKIEYIRSVRNPFYETESISECYLALLKLLKSNQSKYTPTDKQIKLEPAIEYIEKNYNKPLNNDFLAGLIGVSTVYFRKLFSDVCGKSPGKYITDLRMKKAAEMLKSDYGTISDIAQSVGYSSIYDFSRAFKKYTGISPSKY